MGAVRAHVVDNGPSLTHDINESSLSNEPSIDFYLQSQIGAYSSAARRVRLPHLHRRGLRSQAAILRRRLRCGSPRLLGGVPCVEAQGDPPAVLLTMSTTTSTITSPSTNVRISPTPSAPTSSTPAVLFSISCSSSSPPSHKGLSIYHINIQSMINNIKRAQLFGQLEKYTLDIMAITETWLDASFTEVVIPNYVIVSRRDRPQINVAYMNHGGVAVYKRNNAIPITKLEESPVAERIWHTIHTNNGPVLFGAWYRPQRNSANHIQSFDDDFGRLASDHMSHIVVGDWNIWHKKWLRFSPCNSPEDDLMHGLCQQFSLKEITGAPTRGPNLLD